MRFRSNLPALTAVVGRSVLAACLLLGVAATAAATDYVVFGKVMQISEQDATDPVIDNADLLGDGFPFAHVRVYDVATADLLGEADAGMNGQFNLSFTLPASAPAPRILIRAFDQLDGHSDQLAGAREDINLFPAGGGGISTGQLAYVKITSDTALEYNDKGFRPYPGVGLVFTRVGKVEIPEISQTPATSAAGGLFGLADIDDAARAAELGVSQFQRAPFAGQLKMFGDFGKPGGLACPGTQIDWYQVLIEPVDYDGSSLGTAVPWQESMSKRRTEVVTAPSLSVHVTTQKIGPFKGFLDNPATPGVDAGTAVSDLYWVNRNEVGAFSTTIFSYPDLRVNWTSSLYNGWYKVSLVYYQQLGQTAAGEPILRTLPMSTCFANGVPSGDADDVALHQLYLRVDNHPLSASFDGIYLRNRATGDYYLEGGADTTRSLATDFNDEGLCKIMYLQNAYDVEVDYTAWHSGGFLRSYSLDATSNDRTTTVWFSNESFADHTSDADPIWYGRAAGDPPFYRVPEPANGAVQQPSGDLFDHACAYDFDLVAHTRLQNGYNYVRWSHKERAYYVDPSP